MSAAAETSNIQLSSKILSSENLLPRHQTQPVLPKTLSLGLNTAGI